VDIHSVTAGIDENPDAPRNRICRQCATEVMLWGIKDWWIRERQKGFLEETVTRRPDCKEGTSCSRQKDLGECMLFGETRSKFTQSRLQRMQGSVSSRLFLVYFLCSY
jgi:E3 ubiquitin-protein ligase CHFR